MTNGIYKVLYSVHLLWITGHYQANRFLILHGGMLSVISIFFVFSFCFLKCNYHFKDSPKGNYCTCISLWCVEKELVLEIERLKRKNGPATTVNGKKGKSASKLDAFIRSIEEERNYYKDQTEALQKMVRGEIPSRSRSPVRSRPSSRSGSPIRDVGSKSDKKVSRGSTL